jgi:hypothetical protein
MNILIASVFSIGSYSRGIMPDVLQSQLDKYPNATIYYLSCSNTFDVCYFNIHKQPDVCYRCKTGVKNTLELVSGNFKHLKIEELISSADKQKAASFFSDKPIVEFDQFFENFEVGAATLSTYISRSRDRDLIDVNQDYVKELAVNALSFYLGLQRFLEKEKIDVVYNFNGRQDYVRAVMRASLSKNIDCYNVERARFGGNVEFYKNVLPHDIRYKANLVEQCWRESELSEAEKIEIGSNFFDRQKLGESIIFPSYTQGMTKEEVPDYLSNGNKNIVLFNSSDDEFAALGEEYRNPFFKNQNEGLEYLSDLFGERIKNFNLIIRMHPNLAGVKHKYVEEIKQFHQKYSNIFVIEPESKIDSYALMEKAHKVISFGSTTGLEANFFRKPVILLGKGIYFYSEVAYIPENKEEIEALITSDLKPKPILDTLKFGFYFLKGGTKSSYYQESNRGDGVFFKKEGIHIFTIPQRIKARIIQKTFQFFKLRLKF